jgi:hypothetical protein
VLIITDRTQAKDILQTASAVLASDATTTSTTYVDLLSVTVTTAGGTSLECYCSFSTSNATDDAGTGQDFLRLTIDGVQLSEAGAEQWPVSETGAICRKTPLLDAGSHTVKLQWKTQAGHTFRCSASSLTRPEHASLVVVETSG